MDRRLIAAAALLAAVAGAAGAQDWRRAARPADRERLRGWRAAWTAATPHLPPGEGALFDPDAAMDGALPPAGTYRCRGFRLGRSGGTAATAGCRVTGDGPVRRLAVEGTHRREGLMHADTSSRAVFLGTVVLADEARAMPYGRDARRDAAGLVERVGPRRWRVVLPYPPMGAVLDVVELVPEEGASR